MKYDKNWTLSEKIQFGIKRGVARALMEHKKNNRSIYISKNGRVVKIPPEDIKVDERYLQDD